jgi:hypothetical protein
MVLSLHFGAKENHSTLDKAISDAIGTCDSQIRDEFQSVSTKDHGGHRISVSSLRTLATEMKKNGSEMSLFDAVRGSKVILTSSGPMKHTKVAEHDIQNQL